MGYINGHPTDNEDEDEDEDSLSEDNSLNSISDDDSSLGSDLETTKDEEDDDDFELEDLQTEDLQNEFSFDENKNIDIKESIIRELTKAKEPPIKKITGSDRRTLPILYEYEQHLFSVIAVIN